MARIKALVLGVVLAAVGAPATACINDIESKSHEREFRSQYGGLAGFPRTEGSAARRRAPLDLLRVGGVLMLVGATWVLARRAGTRN